MKLRWSRWPRALGLLVMGLLSGCSPVSMLNALVPEHTYRIAPALPYGELPRQKLDVYAPAAGAVNAPVVVFFYGGSWESGRREDYRFVGEALASIGAVAVVADYRIYPEALFPVFLNDAADAVKWATEHAKNHGGNADKLYLMGHSAGAHIAMMLATDRQYLARVGMSPKQLRGAIGLAGPYDFLPLTSDRLKEIFGAESDWPRSQPVNFVSAEVPPLLLATGNEDSIVKPRNTASLAARVRDAGGWVKEISYPDTGHASILVDLSVPFRRRSPVLRDVAEFIRATPVKVRPSAHQAPSR